LSGRQKAVLTVFALTFALLIYSVIPWSDFGLGIPTLGWWFGELSALFAFSAVLIGIIAGFGEKKLVSIFIAGTRDFLGAALIVAVARGVTVVMHNGRITDTILYSLEGVLRGAGAGMCAMLMFLVNAALAFLVPSSSGHAALAIPILAPLADFAHVSRAIAVTAFTAGNATLNMFTPTSAVLMAGLGISYISYGAFFRVLLPLLAVIAAAVIIILFVAASV